MCYRYPCEAAHLESMQVGDDPSREKYSREAISLLMLYRKLRKSEDLFGDSNSR